MATLSEAKTLGGIGAILTLIPIVSIIGWILVLIAVKYISDVAADRDVFNDFLIAAITAIVGAAAAASVFVSGVIFGLFTGGLGAISGIILGLAVAWIALIISAVFLRKSYEKVAMRTGVKIFNTAALLYLIGAALVIIFGLGFVLLFVAEILQIVAFFSLPDQLPMGASPMAPPMPPPAPTAV